MKLMKPEKIILVILSITLLAGAALLHIRHSRPRIKVEIIKNGVKEEFTLRQVEGELKESRKIDINIAAAEELTVIPGVGEKLAGRIVEYRNSHGKFYRPDDLSGVKGIGEKKLAKIKEYVKVRDPL